MNSKYTNKNGEKKLLATLAVFAMVLVVAGAFIAVGSVDSDAAATEGVIPSDVTVTKLTSRDTGIVAGAYYVDSTGVSITNVDLSSATNDVVIYLLKGKSVTFTGDNDTKINDKIKIYAVSEVDSTGIPTKYIDGYFLIPKSSVAVSCDSTSGLLKAANVDSDSSYSAVFVSDSVGTYYYNGYEFVGEVSLAASTSITVVNNSVTVVVGGNKVSLSGVQGSIVVGNNTDNMTINGSFSSGTITMKEGSAANSGITITSPAKLNAFSTTAVSSSGTISADCPDAATVYVYGNAASKATIAKTNTDTSVNFRDASSNSVTIQKLDNSGAVLNSVMVNVVGDVTITGSGVISGLTNANITLISGSFSIKADVGVTLGNTITVSAGTTLDIKKVTEPADVDLSLAGVLNVYGTLKSSDDVTVTVAGAATGAKPGEFRSYAGSIISNKVTIIGATGADVSPIIDIATEDKVVSGSAMGDETYYQSQNVIVNGSYDVKNSSTIIIYGGFEIPAGAVVTITAGSSISVQGSASIVNIAGKLILEGNAQFTVADTARSVTVSGQIETDDESTLSISAQSTVISDGGVISSVGTLTGTALTVGEGSKLIIGGSATITNIYNKGTVTLDGAVLGNDVIIHNIVAGAEVDVKSFTTTNTGYTLKIDDDGLVNSKGTEITVSDNSVEFTAYTANTGYAGLTVVSGVTTIPGSGSTPDSYTKEMYINGEVSFVDVTLTSSATANIAIEGSVIIDGTLDLGKGVKVTIGTTNSSVLVSGTFDAFDGTLDIDSNGDVTVTGELIYNDEIASNINAAQYVVKVSGVDYYNYTTFSNAIDSGSKSILLLGTVVLLESDEIPAGVTVDVNGAFSVGSIEKTDVVLSVKEGATFKKTSGSVTVDGTLEFADKTNNKVAGIVSDVEVTGEKTLVFTNVYTALSGEAADVTVTGAVELTKDLTVGKDSKLTIPLGKSITVNDNVTLTIEGELIVNGFLNADTEFADKASTTTSAIIVTGIIKSTSDLSFEDYAIAGAYYDDGAVYTITTIENAVLSGYSLIKVCGKVAEDVSIVLADDIVFNVAAGADVALDGIELQDDASVVVASGGSIDTAVKTSTTTVQIDGEFTISNVSATATVPEHTEVTNINGEITIEDGTLVSNDPTIGTGSQIVIVGGATLDIPKDTTLTINDDKANIVIEGTLSVEGTLTISLTEETPVVYGTLDINANGSSVYALQVIGVLDVASNKSVSVGELTVGSLESLGANGIVVGKVITDSIKAYKGADTSAMDMTGLVSTDFYVNDVLFATVITTSAAAPLIVSAITDDELAVIPGVVVKDDTTWYKANGLKVTTEKVGKIDAVYATLDTADVSVIVSVEPGIQLELDYRFYTETGSISLSAGTYKVAAKDLAGEKSVRIIMVVDSVETVIDNGEITIDSKMIGKKVIVQASYGTAPVGPTEPTVPSEDYIVSVSYNDGKVIVSVIALDGGYIPATDVTVTFSGIGMKTILGQTVPAPVTIPETFNVTDDNRSNVVNKTFELENIIGENLSIMGVSASIGQTNYGYMSLGYKS